MRLSSSTPERLEYLPAEELCVQVTEQPTTQLYIQCGPNFGWSIEFRLIDTDRLVGRAPPPITVGDVLVKLYQFMSEPIEEADWASIPGDFRSEVDQAQERRCNTMGSGGKEERGKGPKKIDYFTTHVWFGGLSIHGRTKGGVLILRLAMSSGDDVLML